MSKDVGMIIFTTEEDIWMMFKKKTFKYMKSINYDRRGENKILNNYGEMYEREKDYDGNNVYKCIYPFVFVGSENITKEFKISMIKYVEKHLKEYGEIFYQDVYNSGATAYENADELIKSIKKSLKY